MMRWIEYAPGPLPFAACDSKVRPRAACRRIAALSWLLSTRACHGDSRKIHPFHPAEREGVERLTAPMAVSRFVIYSGE